MALKCARAELVDARVSSEAKRTAAAALLAIPWLKNLIREVGTRNLTVLLAATAARPLLPDFLRHLRQTVFWFWRANLSYLEGNDGRLSRDAPA